MLSRNAGCSKSEIPLFQRVYEFAASAGALEGYVYRRTAPDMEALPKWADNLVKAYKRFSPEVREAFQASCDQTLGRAIRSLIPLLGEKHEVVQKLKSLVKGHMPDSADDFKKKKWFEE
jgi:hypothetical protein